MYKRITGVLMAVMLLTIISASAYLLTRPPVGEETFPRVTVLAPDWSGFVPDAHQWNFGTMLLTPSTEVLEARSVGAQIGNQFVSSLDEDEWTEVARVGRQVEGLLDEYEELRQSMVEQHAEPGGLTAHIVEGKYQDVRWRIYGILREQAEEIGGILVIIPPMQVDLGETAIVELIFEIRRKNDPTRTYRVAAPTPVTNLYLPPEGIVEPDYEPRGVFERRWYTHLVEKESWPQMVVVVAEVVFEDHTDYMCMGARLITSTSLLLEGRYLGVQIGDRFVADWYDFIWAIGCVRVEGLPKFILEELQVQEVQIHRILEELEEPGEMQEVLFASSMVPSGTINPGETLDVELAFEVRKIDDPTEMLRFTIPTRLTRVKGRS